MQGVVIDLTFIFTLVLLNAFFVATETALFSTRKSRMDELSKKKHFIPWKFAKRFTRNIGFFISATQFGSTLTSIAIGWRGERIFSNYFGTFLKEYVADYPFLSNSFITSVVPFIMITFIVMIFAELVPKKLSMHNPEKYILFLSIPMTLFSQLFMPFIHGINRLSDFILKLLGRNPQSKRTPVSEMEIGLIVDQSVKDGIIPASLHPVIKNALILKHVRSDQVMTPFSKIIGFYSEDSLENVEKKIVLQNLRHNRYPVYDHQGDIYGYFELSEFFTTSHMRRPTTKLKELGIIRSPITVSTETTLDIVWISMLPQQIFIAIVRDKKNKVKGMLSVTDIIYQLVGSKV